MEARVVTIMEKGIVQLTKEELEPKENEVLVKTKFSSICGTDKNYFKKIVPPGDPYYRPVPQQHGGQVCLSFEGGP